MRIAIVGAGAMGQLFGAHLAAAEEDVVMIDAMDETIRGINDHGMTVVMGERTVRAAAPAARAADVGDPVDLIIIFTKTMHTEAAFDSVRHLASEQTLGLSVQNGLGNERALVDLLGAERTLIGMTDFPADRRADGVIHSDATGHVLIGGVRGGATESDSAAARQVASVLDQAGLNAEAHPEVLVPIWEKVIFNAAMNTISAATGLTVGGMGREPAAQRLVESVLSEAFSVAHAQGVAVDEERLRATLDVVYVEHAEHKTSMLADIEAGRPTEIDAIGGAVSDLGQREAVPTPVLSALCDVVRLRSAAS